MLITPDELSQFSGKYPDDDSLQKKYIASAQEIISGYLNFDPEEIPLEKWKKTRNVTVFVYSSDGVTYYSDENMNHEVTIPDGVTLERTLVDNQYWYEQNEEYVEIPSVIYTVCLEIATLIQLEEENNLGVNSKSFGESGSRTFLNVTDYSRYLARLSRYRLARIY